MNTDIIFTLESNSTGKTGIYYFKDVDGNGDMNIGDKISLLAVIDVVSLTTTEFAAG